MDKLISKWVNKHVVEPRDNRLDKIDRDKDKGIKVKKPTLHELCSVGDFKVQEQQTLVSKFINPKTSFKNLLVYHKIGSGKTCAGIQIAENFDKVLVIVPASLKTNFYDELLSKCTGNRYVTDNIRGKINDSNTDKDERKRLIDEAYMKIEKRYTIISYNKLFDMYNNSKNELFRYMNGALVLIDEIHNLISNTGISSHELTEITGNDKIDFRLVLMTATPIINKANELALLFNYLNRNNRDKLLPTGNYFDEMFIDGNKIKNRDILIDCFRNLVSYYPGADKKSFPKKNMNVIRCVMSPFQRIQYEKYRRDPNNRFYIKTKMVSNIAYPNGKLGFDGYKSLKSDNLSIKNIAKYSNKYYRILRFVLNKNNEGLQFIYCSMLEYGGLRPLIRLFESNGFVNYETNGEPSSTDNRMRYVVWSSDMSNTMRQEIKRVINSKENKNASIIKVVFGSPAIKEGVSFKRVRDVHLVGPSWTIPEQDQIVGRGYRFCSHYDLPAKKRVLNIFIYISVTVDSDYDENSDEETILINSYENNLLNQKFLTLLENSAIDCRLFNDNKNCLKY